MPGDTPFKYCNTGIEFQGRVSAMARLYAEKLGVKIIADIETPRFPNCH